MMLVATALQRGGDCTCVFSEKLKFVFLRLAAFAKRVHAFLVLVFLVIFTNCSLLFLVFTKSNYLLKFCVICGQNCYVNFFYWNQLLLDWAV